MPHHHWELLSGALSRAAESFVEESGLLARDTVLCKYYVNHLSELLKFLIGTGDSVADNDLFPHRYSLLVLARCVAQEVN